MFKYELNEVMINDINKELINAYKQIKSNVNNLVNQLDILQKLFWDMSQEERKDLFYGKRERYNSLIALKSKENKVEKAALFIFLNKTCFNGLYRVNKKGYFNVPIGKYKRPIICDSDNLINTSKLLRKVKISHGDYSQCENFIDKATFVYIDPPYRPINSTSQFTTYSADGFNDEDQIKLGEFVDRINNKGAKFIISNSDPKNTDMTDNFLDDIYSSYDISRITAKRMINCNGESRGNVSELLISNY